MTKVWKKVPKTIRLCACGCGVRIVGTKSRMYAKPYCKFKSYLERKKSPNWIPDSRFDPRRIKDNPLNEIPPFQIGDLL